MTGPVDCGPAGFLLDAMLGELAKTASHGQRRAFMRAVGRRIAGSIDVGDVDDLATLQQRLDTFWHAAGWGSTDLSLSDDGVLIIHSGVPMLTATPGDDSDAVRSMLEGAYDCWMRQLGSDTNLSTRVIGGSETQLRLWHGR